jgi:hypothetical protein
MPLQRVPSYTFHKPTEQARVRINRPRSLFGALQLQGEPCRLSTTFTYDATGELLSETYADGSSDTYTDPSHHTESYVTGRLKTSHFGARQNQPVVFDVIHSADDSRQEVVG